MVKNQYGIECFGAILSETAASIDAYKLAHEQTLSNLILVMINLLWLLNRVVLFTVKK